MEFLLALWLPILLSAGAVWILSNLAWIALPHHRNDFVRLPDEDAFAEFVRRSHIPPGNYLFPDFRGREAMQSEKVAQAIEHGPVGHLSVWRTPLTMGSRLVGTLVVHLVVSTLIAYLTRVALPGAEPFARVFQIAATAGVLAYCFSSIPNALWFGAYPRAIVAAFVDGIVYGLITGVLFAWNWPH